MSEELLRHRVQLRRMSFSLPLLLLVLGFGISSALAQSSTLDVLFPIPSSPLPHIPYFTTLTNSPSLSFQTGTAPTSTRTSYASTVPNIDVCGRTQGGVSCPGAGQNSFYYRCCSSSGHCGPKNNIQDQAVYCGTGCQSGYGKCDSKPLPPLPTTSPGVAQEGQTCGPIVNKKCASGLCCKFFSLPEFLYFWGSRTHARRWRTRPEMRLIYRFYGTTIT